MLLYFSPSLEGSPLPSSHKFIGSGLFSWCPMCLFTLVLMPPRQRKSNQKGSFNHYVYKMAHPFAFESVASDFDAVPLEVPCEILILESMEVGDYPY